MLEIIAVLAIALLGMRFIGLSQHLYRHNLVSEIAELRRQLIRLVHEDKVDANSDLFKFTYETLELLLRVRHFRLMFLLPSTKDLLVIHRLSKDENRRIETVVAELKELVQGSAGEEIRTFYVSFVSVLTKALIKNRLVAVAKLLKALGYQSAKRGLVSLRSIAHNMNDVQSAIERVAH